MKTFRHLYEQIITFENLYQAWRIAARDKAEVATFELYLEENLFTLQADLSEHPYRPGDYRSFHIQDLQLPIRRKYDDSFH